MGLVDAQFEGKVRATKDNLGLKIFLYRQTFDWLTGSYIRMAIDSQIAQLNMNTIVLNINNYV